MKLIKLLLASGLIAIFGSNSIAAEVGEDGLHLQPFFSDTFLDMGEDLADATADGKDLMIIIEQRGCPYCAEMHAVNFEREEIVKHIEEHYLVVQLNMWGSREVTDFDGETLSEKDLVSKWFANFTPTTFLLAWDDPDTPPANMREALAFMMPGYFKPFHHISGLEYVTSDGYKTQPNFQRWLQAKADHMREQGLDVDLWD